jgi:hypothetical protein
MLQLLDLVTLSYPTSFIAFWSVDNRNILDIIWYSYRINQL